MTIRKSSVVVVTMSMLAFSCVVLAIGNLQGEEGQNDSTTAERPGKAESEQLKNGMDARALRRLENVEVDALTDNDLRAAVKTLAAQVRHLNERVDRLENPTPRIHRAKSLESQKGSTPLRGVDLEVFEMAQKGIATADRELQRALAEIEELKNDVSTTQAELDAKKAEVTRLRKSREKLAGLLREIAKTVGSNPPRTND